MQDGVLFKMQKNEFENQAASLHWNLHFTWKYVLRDTIVLPKKAFENECLSNSSIKKWHKEFKDGQKSIHDAPQCGRPRTSTNEGNTDTIASIIGDDRHLSTRTLPSLLNILKMSVVIRILYSILA